MIGSGGVYVASDRAGGQHEGAISRSHRAPQGRRRTRQTAASDRPDGLFTRR